MEQVLLQSSENIKSLINIIMLHEENISRNIPHDPDISMNLSNPLNSNTFIDGEYLSQPRWGFIAESYEQIILVRECGHTFKREPFMQWIKKHNTCMYCRALLF